MHMKRITLPHHERLYSVPFPSLFSPYSRLTYNSPLRLLRLHRHRRRRPPLERSQSQHAERDQQRQ